jgi:hypothetical protein
VIELDGIAIAIAGLDDLIAMKRERPPVRHPRHRSPDSDRRRRPALK